MTTTSIFANTGRLGVFDLTTVDTAAQHALGTIVSFKNGVTGGEGEAIYVQFAGTTTVGMPCRYNMTTKAIVADADSDTSSGESIGFAMGAAYAADEYGWLQIAGKTKVKAGAVAAGGSVFLTATAGTCDDAAVAGNQIVGAQFDTADGTPAAGFAYATINRPSIQTQYGS